MTAPIRRRSRSREIAMQLLFQLDLRGDDYPTQLNQTMEQLCQEAAENDREIAEYALRLVTGVVEQREAIDCRLRTVARNWDLKRMANVDRNVLRLATFELSSCSDVPHKVAINEAIELGKKFSTANSGGFINGILDRVRLDLERERAAPRATPAVDSGSDAASAS